MVLPFHDLASRLDCPFIQMCSRVFGIWWGRGFSTKDVADRHHWFFNFRILVSMATAEHESGPARCGQPVLPADCKVVKKGIYREIWQLLEGKLHWNRSKSRFKRKVSRHNFQRINMNEPSRITWCFPFRYPWLALWDFCEEMIDWIENGTFFAVSCPLTNILNDFETYALFKCVDDWFAG